MNLTFISHSTSVGELLCGELVVGLAEVGEQQKPQIRRERSRGAAAMASGILVNVKEEVTCPICLELLTEPMSLDCGHTFCQACITANNRGSMIGQGKSSCPVCRITYQPENLRPNRHVANIVEALREVKLSPQEEQKRDLCVDHGEKLLLFCNEDKKIICWLCERSREHRGHQIFLMEEIAQKNKEKLQAALDRLRAEQQEAEKLDDNLEEERTSRKDQIEHELKRVQDCFKQLRGILASEEQKELQSLKKEAAENLDDLAQAEGELAQQKKLLRDLISDLEHLLQGSTVEMLQDVKGIMERSKTFTLKKPKTLSKKQRRVFQAPDLRGMLQVFNELTGVRRYWVHVTLDPPTNKSNIVISADRRQVRPSRFSCFFGGDNMDFGVLGSPSITSGKHYWEVDVSQKRAWIMGVYGENYRDSIIMDFIKLVNNSQPICSRFKPKYGYWVIGLQNHSEYKAFVDSASSDSTTLTLYLSVPPRRVGVFLDYDAGTVSFFNVTNHGFLIYKFSSCSFSQKMFPYFNPMKCSAPMTLCSQGS
ncbi:tripartite motif-containing protein 5-like isoform X4 [Myotis daubentonii]|uniref:tripartite motif-containing protein 5-like isoform X4 n=1 Tax=Myotis daubentonii TaxID=98922 RepID=UPI002873F3D6|nr:tripartite motif-containing protein 5-like isoform X4 [Myotis daubentonii]